MQSVASPAQLTPASAPSAVVVASSSQAHESCGHVSLSLLEKIKRAEYIELSALLPPTQSSDESLAKRVKLSEDDGQLVLTAASSTPKRKLDSLSSWLEAWSVYCCIVFAEQSSKAAELMEYQLRIVQAARKYPWTAVLDYDTRFRQKAARTPTLRWDSVDTDLYTRCFTGQGLTFCSLCKRPGHVATACTSRQPREKESRKSGNATTTCDLYNRGNCSFRPCKFLHQCNVCGGDHPATNCRK